jgi:hypothetical protein
MARRPESNFKGGFQAAFFSTKCRYLNSLLTVDESPLAGRDQLSKR